MAVLPGNRGIFMKKRNILVILIRVFLTILVLFLFFYILLAATGNIEENGLFSDAVLLLTLLGCCALFLAERKR